MWAWHKTITTGSTQNDTRANRTDGGLFLTLCTLRNHSCPTYSDLQVPWFAVWIDEQCRFGWGKQLSKVMALRRAGSQDSCVTFVPAASGQEANDGECLVKRHQHAWAWTARPCMTMMTCSRRKSKERKKRSIWSNNKLQRVTVTMICNKVRPKKNHPWCGQKTRATRRRSR